MPAGTLEWVEVSTTPEGDSSLVWLTTLIQTLKLNRGESPFYANYGIPAQQSVVTQIIPDFFVLQTQQQFAPYFAALVITKIAAPDPTYLINALTFGGQPYSLQVAVPS